MKREELVAIVEKTSTGFSGYLKDIPGITTGETLKEMIENFEEIKEMYVEDLKERGKDYEKIEQAKIIVKLDMKQFFDYFNFISKSALADRLGINRSLFRQYTSGLASLSDKRVKVISDGLHDIADELNSVSLA